MSQACSFNSPYKNTNEQKQSSISQHVLIKTNMMVTKYNDFFFNFQFTQTTHNDENILLRFKWRTNYYEIDNKNREGKKKRTGQGGDAIDRSVEATDGEPSKALCPAGQRSQTWIRVCVRQRRHVSVGFVEGSDLALEEKKPFCGPEKLAKLPVRWLKN